MLTASGPKSAVFIMSSARRCRSARVIGEVHHHRCESPNRPDTKSWTWLGARPSHWRHRGRSLQPPRSITIGRTGQIPRGTCVARSRVNGGDVRDFAIELTDRPGELGRVATALSRYGVNLKAVTGLALEKHVLVRIIADDPDAARAALQGAGIRFTEGEVVQVLLENRAGELAAITNKLSEA